ncbi:hypothetical protein P8452_07221 [Trifolium repens]|nr:hypothetical protein P8452_07221 [Trifolium repens]
MDKNKHTPLPDTSNASQTTKCLKVNKKNCVKFKKSDESSSSDSNKIGRRVLNPITNNPLFIASKKQFEVIQNQYNFGVDIENNAKHNSADTNQTLPLNTSASQVHNAKQCEKLIQNRPPEQSSTKSQVPQPRKKVPKLNLNGPSIFQKHNFIPILPLHSLSQPTHSGNNKSKPSILNPITPILITGFGSQSFPNKNFSTVKENVELKTSPSMTNPTIPIPRDTSQNLPSPSTNHQNPTPTILIQGFGSKSFTKSPHDDDKHFTPSNCNNIPITSPNNTQPNTLHKIGPEPSRRYNTRGVNLYNKFSSTVDSGESSSANATNNGKRKSQYSHIFKNHQIEDESSESDSNNANDSDSQPQEDDMLTDDENSSIDSDEDDDGPGYLDIGDPVWESIAKDWMNRLY